MNVKRQVEIEHSQLLGESMSRKIASWILHAMLLLVSGIVWPNAVGTAAAQQPFTLSLGNPIQTVNDYPGEKFILVDRLEPDPSGGYARGGSLYYTALPGPTDVCGQEKFRFSWQFDRDVSTVTEGEVINLTLRIDPFPGVGCFHQNPVIVVSFPSDFQEPHGYNQYEMCFDATCYNNPNPARVQFRVTDSRLDRRYPTLLEFYFGSGYFGGAVHEPLGYRIRYPFWQPTALPPEVQVMSHWALGDARFGATINGTFVQDYPGWLTGWRLSSVDFNFNGLTGGSPVRVFLATNIANPLSRWVIFWDPDTGAWSGWLPA